MAILNSLKYSIVKGGKPVSDLLIRELSRVKDPDLIKQVYESMEPWWIKSIRPFDRTVQDLFEQELEKRETPYINVNDNVNDNDNDNEDSYHDSYHDSSEEVIINETEDISYVSIVSYLNEKCGTRYFPTTRKTKDLIKARWNEGFRAEDFYKVIDIKAKDWLKNEEMSKYLRPETLFGTKFESYLNQPTVKTHKEIQTEKILRNSEMGKEKFGNAEYEFLALEEGE